MKTVINMTTSNQDMDRYVDKHHLREFYESRNLDGLEVMFTGNTTELHEKMQDCNVVGIHLSFSATWMDHWLGHTKESQDMIAKASRELDQAEKLQVEYVVFHVSEITPEETLTYQCKYSDAEVIEASIDCINMLLADKDYSFYFLCENLWWAGFNFRSPQITKRLMEGIQYDKKGIMLDTGHLLHTNTNLRTQDEAVDYINCVLDTHEELIDYIKGIHLHQTLSGEYVSNMLKNQTAFEKEGKDRFIEIMMHIYKIDTHRPFTSHKLPKLLERIDPLFLNHELITSSLEEHSTNLDEQLRAVRGV